MSRQIKSAAVVLLLFLLTAHLAGQESAESGSPTQSAASEAQADLESRLVELEDQLMALRREIVTTKALAESRAAEIEGSSTLSFELDALTGGTAFNNENEIQIDVALARGTVAEKEQSERLAATISLSRFNIAATEEGLTVAPGKVDARLLWGEYYLLLSQAPEFLLDKAAAFSSRSENVRTNRVTAAGGATIGREARGSSLAFMIGSYEDDARHNYKNQYGIGLDVAQRIVRGLLSVEGGLTYGLQLGYIRDDSINFTSRDIGFSIKPKLTFSGLGLGVEAFAAADFLLPYDTISRSYGDLRFDARLDAEIRLSETAALEDGSTGYSRVGISLYGIPMEGIYDTEIALIELPASNGFVPVVGFDLTLLLLDLANRSSDGFGFEVGGGLEATFGDRSKVIPFVRSSFVSIDNTVTLNVGIKSKLVGDTVELRAEYKSTDISHYDGDMGLLKFQCKVMY